jgi:hypothetical protein
MHRKDHVSFSTNMTSEDESSGNDSCMQNTNALTSAVDCFHARKFGVKKGENVEKRAALKVVNPGKAKKQKTPVKASLQGASKNMGQESVRLMLSNANEEPREKLDVEMADEAAAQMVDPKTLTGSPAEARREQ